MSDNETPSPKPPTPIGLAGSRSERDHDADGTAGTEPAAPVPIGRAWSPEVIDLRGLDSLAAPRPTGPGVKVRVERHVSPLDAMSEKQKMRLYIRVLCELVAYGEPDQDDDPEPEPTLIA